MERQELDYTDLKYGCLFVAEEEEWVSVTICADNIEKFVAMGTPPFTFMIPLCEQHYHEHKAFHILEGNEIENIE